MWLADWKSWCHWSIIVLIRPYFQYITHQNFIWSHLKSPPRRYQSYSPPTRSPNFPVPTPTSRVFFSRTKPEKLQPPRRAPSVASFPICRLDADWPSLCWGGQPFSFVLYVGHRVRDTRYRKYKQADGILRSTFCIAPNAPSSLWRRWNSQIPQKFLKFRLWLKTKEILTCTDRRTAAACEFLAKKALHSLLNERRYFLRFLST